MSNPKGFKGMYKPLPLGGFCGIDPGGTTGGFGYVTDDGFAVGWKMPKTETEIWRLMQHVALSARLIVIESVHAMPKNGAVSSFSFGRNFGELRMAATAVQARREFPSPSEWQGKMRCRTKGDKKVTVKKAEELWPKLRITHAIADALLLAEYGRRFGNVLRVAR